ncbi:hypothetical protein V5O48_012875 [Marasmius crinis-equi]|uniref:F-box domain-containing protein n=1 Tax=Marasmius crinis-equi TaxID=585013 RepID=A0ABR3F1M3_9AGAR
MNPKAYPHDIRNVSRRWRWIADNLRRLWDRVALIHHPLLYTQKETELKKEMVDRWFASACGEPSPSRDVGNRRHISFRLRTGCADILTDAEKISVRALNKYSRHWRHAVFNIHPRLLERFTAARGQLDNLLSLHLTLQDSCGPSLQSTINVFELAPKLQSVHCDGVWDSFLDKHIINLPWHQITTISIEERSTFDFFHTMKFATSATTALVRPASLFAELGSEQPLLNLPKLRSLYYLTQDDYASGKDDDYEEEEGGLFGYLELPGLDHLLIEDAWDASSCEAALEMLKRSNAKLSMLHIIGPGSGEDWGAGCLRLVQGVGGSVKSVVLSSLEAPELEESIIDAVIADRKNGFPKLRKLLFDEKSPEDIEESDSWAVRFARSGGF